MPIAERARVELEALDVVVLQEVEGAVDVCRRSSMVSWETRPCP